ncbi:MAG: T9SS type A sorting domain-containing protein [Tannerella sp.]|jgi:hypothetical protein|nr:T9SS type A sorting domain-containing protein [Tannerella sp.]
MKRILLLTVWLVWLGFNAGIAQTYTVVTNVKTPNNSTVQDVRSLTSSDLSYSSQQLAALAADLAANYGAELIEPPSYKYNCHAYAWHVSEGGSKVWIGYTTGNVTAEDIYWTDGSYVEVPESYATKVSYHQDGNHSAIRLNSTWYQSKWGQGGVVKHYPNNVDPIYQPSKTKKFYVRKTAFSISGSNSICSSGTVTISPTPTSYSWNCSSNLTLSSTSGNSATFSKNSTLGGAGWVSIVSNGIEVVRKAVNVGTPAVTITGPSSTPNGQYATFHAVTPTGANPTGYQWILNPQLNNNVYSTDTHAMDVAFYTAGNYQVVCRATNSCGQGEYTTMNVNVYNTSSYSLAYPNPASASLTVSFNPELVAQTRVSLQTGAATAAARRTFALDVKLYDRFGTLQRQALSAGEEVTLDVAGLPDGIYVLHVHDGIAATPEVHKIIVSH